MKKCRITALLLCAALCGCRENSAQPFAQAETAKSAAETLAEATAQTAAAATAPLKYTDMPRESGSTAVGEAVYKLPERDLLLECFSAGESGVTLAFDKDGRWSEGGAELAERERDAFLRETFSREYYEEHSQYGTAQIYESYEQYREALLEAYELPEDFGEEPPAYEKKIFFDIRFQYGGGLEEPDEELFLRAAEYALYRPVISESAAARLSEMLSGDELNVILIKYRVSGNNIVSVTAEYPGEEPFTERISINGATGVILGDTFVPYDVKELCLTSRSETVVRLLEPDIPADCVIASEFYDENDYEDREPPVYDIEEIAAAFPCLKRLYIYQAVLENAEKLPLFGELETLFYRRCVMRGDGFIDTVRDEPFVGMNSLRELRIYEDRDSFAFLAQMPRLESVYLEASGRDTQKLEQIFSCGAVTGLELKNAAALDGIEKLTRLKKLTVSGSVDLLPLGKLEGLEELELQRAKNIKNASALEELHSLKSLGIDGLEGCSDWSFLLGIEGLESLSLSYCCTGFTDTLKELKQLRSLTLIDIDGHYDCSFIAETEGLEELSFFGYGIYDDELDISGISALKGLKAFSAALCRFSDLSELKSCSALEEVYIYNNNSEFDCKWLEGSGLKRLSISDGAFGGVTGQESLLTLKELEALDLSFTGTDDELLDKIKEALPLCKVTHNEQKYY